MGAPPRERSCLRDISGIGVPAGGHVAGLTRKRATSTVPTTSIRSQRRWRVLAVIQAALILATLGVPAAAMAAVGTVTVNNASQTPSPVIRGGNATFTVTAVNTSGGTTRTFDATQVSGVTGLSIFSSTCATIAPGATGTITVVLATTASTPVGSRAFVLRVSDHNSPACTGTPNSNNTGNGTIVVAAALIATTTAITSDDPDPSTVFSAYTVNVSVTRTSGSAAITGTVTISDGAVSCTDATPTGGAAATVTYSCSLTSTTAGAKTLTASFPANATFAASSDTASHTVSPATSTTVVTCPASVTYTGSAQTPCTVTVTGAGGLSLTPTPVYSANTNVGTATASYTYAGDANHGASSDSRTFAITPATSTTVVTCPASVTYTGSALTPCTVAVTGAGGLSLTPTPVYTLNTAVGTATASYSYAGDANHGASSDSRTFAITPATSTTVVTCAAGPFTYTGSAHTPCTASVTGAGGLNQVLAVGYADNTAAGTATAVASYAGDANHGASTDSTTFDIGKATSTTVVTCAAGPFTYTGSAHTPCTASVTGAGGLSLTPDPDYTANIAVGTVTASYSYVGDANHSASSDSQDFDITQATSTTTVTCPASVTYTGSAQEPCTVTVTGAGGLSLTPDPDYTANIAVGTVTASYSYVGDANHSASSDSQDFDITQATSTTTVTCPASVTYTGSAQEPCTVTVTGAGGLSLTPDPDYTANIAVGTVTASYSYVGDANHSASSDSQDFDITQATSTTTVTCPASVTYTGSAQEPCTVTVTGAGGLSLTPDPDYTANIAVGTVTASYSYVGDANHSASSDSQDFDITQATSTTTVTCPASVTYTGSAQEPCTVTVTGAGGLSLTPDPDYTANIAVGTVTASYSYVGDANHSASSDSQDFDITQATSTTTVTCPASVTYTGSAQEPCTVTVTGAGGLSLTPDPDYTANIAVGTVTASYSYVGDANHSASSDSQGFDITQATSTTVVTFEPGPYTYRGFWFTATAVVTGAGGLSQSVPVVMSGDCVNVTTADGCTATATFEGDANHAGSTDSKSITIAKADAVCTVTGYTGTYDGAAHGATGSCLGVAGQVPTGGIAAAAPPAVPLAGLDLGASFTNAPGGTATWTFTDATGNYNNATGSVAIEIGKAGLTVTPDAKSRTYGDPAPSYTFTVTGFVNGETTGTAAGYAAPSCTSGYTMSTPVAGSPLTITCSGGSATNYTFDTSATAQLTIARADATCTVSGVSVTYDGTAHGATGACTGVNDETLTGLDLGASFTDVPGGTADWTLSNPNYNGDEGSVDITIGKADQTIDFGPLGDKTYGDPYFDIMAPYPGQTITFVSLAPAVCTVDVLQWTTVVDGVAFNGTGVTILAAGECIIQASAPGDDNWNAADPVTQSFTVAPATLTVTPDAKSRTYGDPAPSYTFTVTGFVNGETTGTAAGYAAPSCTSGYTMSTPVAGSPLTITCSGGSATNYTFDTSATAQLTIARADATCTVSGVSVTYDGTAHGATGACTGVNDETLTGLDLGASFTDVPGGTADWTLSNPNYNGDEGSVDIDISAAAQTIEFPALPDVTFGVAGFVLDATTDSGLPVTYTSLTPGVCTISGATVTIVGVGTCTIQASQAGDENHDPAAPVTRSFVVLAADGSTPETSTGSPFAIVGGSGAFPLALLGGLLAVGALATLLVLLGLRARRNDTDW